MRGAILLAIILGALLPALTPRSVTCRTATCTDILTDPDLSGCSVRFNAFNTLVRDNKILREEAIACLRTLLDMVKSEYYQRGGNDFAENSWVFPVPGYDRRAIAAGPNHGFLSSGYDYFDGNRHGGHPALDIFIHDRNQDSLDDQTGKPVKVVSLTGGMVVALEREWAEGNPLRGGKYLWVYDPANQLLIYYAHQDTIAVKLGDIIQPGTLLGAVGRSGLHASQKRSPTHLHLSVLAMKNGSPQPLNVYRVLLKDARTKRTGQ